MRQRLCWCLVVLLHWAIAVYLLRIASPVFIDGAGPMPSFYWGRMPLPDLAEYYSRRRHYDFLYSLPYVLAGLIMTIIGCAVAPLLIRSVKPRSSQIFTGTFVATLGLLLLLALASDAGGILGFWSGPLFFLQSGISPFEVKVLSTIFLPVSLLAGILAASTGYSPGVRLPGNR